MTTNYQQLYIKGVTKEDPFQRECADRYEIIKPLLDRFQRRFSVFDLGANLGYFTIRLQDELDCFTIGADRLRGQLKQVLQENQPRNMAWINRHLTPEDLSRLANCEQFDVGLILNVLHHYPDPRQAVRAFRSLQRLCRFLILEICPPEGDRAAKNPATHAAIYEAVNVTPGAELIAETRSHLEGNPPRYIYLIDNGLMGFTNQQTFDSPERCPHSSMCKIWQFTDRQPEIEIVKADPNIEQVFTGGFIPGINLWNMIILGYGWPGEGWLEKEYEIVLEAEPHDDPLPWNWIFDGKLHGIDNGYKRKQKKFPCDALRLFRHGVEAL
jgi:SAM-dependent methyltransferase